MGMGGAARMDDQCLGITHIGKMGGQFNILNKGAPALTSAFDANGNDRSRPLRHQTCGDVVIWMIGKKRMPDPGDLFV